MAVLLLPLVGCSADEDDTRTLTVFAAASLQESFEELAVKFEGEHDGRVELNFGPSSGLAEQISSGAPADVFASASTTTMEQVSQDAENFAVNTLQVAVPSDNPAGIDDLDDLANRDVKVALCQPDVPCGVVAAQLLDDAGLTITPATEETDVKAVLTKVRLGEVDAGLVYVTDVIAGGDDVVGIEVPDGVNATTDYPIAVLSDDELARAWADLVLSPEGQHVLEEHGFGPAS